MKKIYRHLVFYIKTAGKNLRRHLGMTFSAATAVSITLILISLFALLSMNLSNFTLNIEDQLTIRASIDNITNQKQRDDMMKEIKQLTGVVNVYFHSGEEELEAYKNEYSDDESLFSMYEGKSSPIRDTFVIEAKNAKDIVSLTKTISAIKGVVEASYGGEATNDMVKTFEKIRNGSTILIVFLVLIAGFLISNKIRMSIYTRREEIAVMRHVGAGNWFIKTPMMMEGMAIGVLGAFIPILITIVGYYYFYHSFKGVMLSNMFVLEHIYPMTLYISLMLLAIGVFVGLIGSFVSTTKNLRWKR